jgi:hypothetical protein
MNPDIFELMPQLGSADPAGTSTVSDKPVAPYKEDDGQTQLQIPAPDRLSKTAKENNPKSEAQTDKKKAGKGKTDTKKKKGGK